MVETTEHPDPPKRLVLAVRIALSLAAGYVFVYILVLIAGAHSSLRESQQLSKAPPAIYLGNPHPKGGPVRPVNPLWPEFPRTGPSNLRQSVINGVEILSEDWETAASAEEILSYYRQQMTGRGWSDATEETYGLQPQLRAWKQNESGVQNEKYLDAYRKVTESNLALKRGNWSIHIMIEPGKQLPSGSFVKVFGASTPSIKDFFAGIASVNTESASGTFGHRPLDATQVSGGERYHTTIDFKPLAPDQALQAAVAQFREEGWNPLLSAPTKRSRSGVCLWLTKGSEYAVVVADRASTGSGSTVTITKVTADQ